MLTQLEADALFDLKKRPKSNDPVDFPEAGGKLLLELVSDDPKELFLANVTRGHVDVRQCSYAARARHVYVLRRLDLEGPPHGNPDVGEVPMPFPAPFNGQRLPCPHLHLYVEGFLDKWAIPPTAGIMDPAGDLYNTMRLFLTYCKVDPLPTVLRGLFI